MGDGQIHEAHRKGLAQAVPQGLPFRGELGERIEDGAAGIVGERTRARPPEGTSPIRARTAAQIPPSGGPFDQQAVGLHCFQSPQQAAGAPGPWWRMPKKSNGLIRHGEAFCKLLGEECPPKEEGAFRKPFSPNRHAGVRPSSCNNCGAAFAPFAPRWVHPEKPGIRKPLFFRRHTHG